MPAVYPIRLHEQIARLRKKHRMSQEKFAEALGVSGQAVSKWETGACCPDIQLLPAIAACLGVSIDALFAADDPAARARLLTRYECTGDDADFAAAAQAYEQALEAGTATLADRRDYAVLLARRGISSAGGAEEMYENILCAAKDSRDEDYYRTHIQYIRLLCWRGRADVCVRRYQRMTAAEPDNWWAVYLLALSHMQAGDKGEAGRLLRGALKRFPGNFYLYTLAGDLAEGAGAYESALSYWEKAYADNPRQIACLYNGAAMLERLGRRREAVEMWRRIVDWHHANELFREGETDMPLQHIRRLLAGEEKA